MAASCGRGNAGIASKVENLLQCPICLETLNDPRSLPCFHSFCKNCLEKIVANTRKKYKIEEFNCPTCRSVFTLKWNEQVSQLSCSHFIRNMLEAVQLQDQAKHAKCSRCIKQDASCRCLTCELFLCEQCLAEHNLLRESWPCLTHIKPCSVLTLEDFRKPENQSRIKAKTVLYCNKHKEKKLKFYCETCKKVICRYCMDFIHVRPEHECSPIEHVVERRKELLKRSVSACEKKFFEGNKALKAISEVKKKFQNNCQRVKESIMKENEQLEQLLLKHLKENAKRKCEEVDKINKMTQQLITKQQNEVQSFVNEVKISYDMAMNVLENGSNDEVITSERVITERVEHVGDTKLGQIYEGCVVHQENTCAFHFEPLPVLPNSLQLGDVKLQCDEDQSFLYDYVNLGTSSKILNGKDEYLRQMIAWLEGREFQWRLCYLASLDGWSAADFHSKCDNKEQTVVVVQVGDFIFGGFTDGNWSAATQGLQVECGKSFMFSLSNKDNLPPFKSLLRKGEKAIFQESSFGAIFGLGSSVDGRDLCICNKANKKNTSFTDFGHSYTLPEGYAAGSEEARSLLAGSFKFTPTEVEVFY